MAFDVDSVALCPFEGPEKLLEIWFAPGPSYVPDAATAPKGRSGLRTIDRKVWEEMLLSESSLFISPHRLILKTCGTTLNLLGLPRILAIAREYAGLPAVYQCFYSRKAFMFPDKQLGPHRDWQLEVEFLDRLFEHGSAYTVGKVNQHGDHWLLYMTSPEDMCYSSGTEISSLASSMCISDAESATPLALANLRKKTREDNWAIVSRAGLYSLPLPPPAPTHQDHTIEILMTHLSPRARSAFYTPESVDFCCVDDSEHSPGGYALKLSEDLGIADIFPRRRTQLDAYSFAPCGYSANALIKWGDALGTLSEDSFGHDHDGSEKKIGEGYYTIHVTPEEGWSYASFECNVPLAARHKSGAATDNADDIPDLLTLVRRVVRIFEPGKITMTLFVQSREEGSEDADREDDDDEGETETAVEAAQRAFKAALTRLPKAHSRSRSHASSSARAEGSGPVGAFVIRNKTGAPNGDSSVITPSAENGGGSKNVHRSGSGGENGPSWTSGYDRVYKRTDKINYEFGGYDLAFASFEAI